jgi:hypothetical protein
MESVISDILQYLTCPKYLPRFCRSFALLLLFHRNFFDCSGLQQNTDSTQIKEASEYQKLSIGRVASSHQNPADHRCKNANHKHELIPKGIDIVSLPQ